MRPMKRADSTSGETAPTGAPLTSHDRSPPQQPSLPSGEHGAAMEALEAFRAATLWLAAGTEAVAALIIRLAVVQGTVGALAAFFRHSTAGTPSRHAYADK